MTSSNLYYRKTSELKVGDVVHNHGLRFLIDQEIKVSKVHGIGSDGSLCRYTKALCISTPEEVAQADELLQSFIRSDNGRWSIQGNDLAIWTVELRITWPLVTDDDEPDEDPSIAHLI